MVLKGLSTLTTMFSPLTELVLPCATITSHFPEMPEMGKSIVGWDSDHPLSHGGLHVWDLPDVQLIGFVSPPPQ